MPPAPPAGAGFSPLDDEVGLLPGLRRTPRWEQLLARFGTCQDFGAAADQFTFVTGVPVSAATARRRTYAAGTAGLAVDVEEMAQIERDLPTSGQGAPRMPISRDATTVPLVGGAGTAVKLVAMGELVTTTDAAGQPAVETQNLSYAGRFEPAETFGRTVTLELERRGVSETTEVARPNDGAKWIGGGPRSRGSAGGADP